MEEIFDCLFGSHLYGTDTAESDVDYKGVYMPSSRSILLGDVLSVISMSDKEDDRSGHQRKNEPGEVDREFFSLDTYLSLLAEGQTGALDMLFATPLIDEGNLEGEYDRHWRTIWNNRHRFASKQAAAFIGYCRNQAAKYGVKGSRMASVKEAAEFFEKAALTYGASTKTICAYRSLADDLVPLEHCALVDIPQGDGSVMKAFECCGRKVMMNAPLSQGVDMYQRVYREYGARAEKAMKHDGIDWKALSHAVRVGRQAIEYLSTGFITFPRPEACHLLKIKRAELDYNEVGQEIEDLVDEVERAAENSSSPDKPDMDWIEDFLVHAYGEKVASCSTHARGEDLF